MGRPEPTIIMSQRVDDYEYDICEADAVYAVCLGEHPVALRRRNAGLKAFGRKYLKTTYTAPGHALRLAERLNKMYGTDEFCVRRLQPNRVW